jgi:multimeric flavodoxin WrbA
MINNIMKCVIASCSLKINPSNSNTQILTEYVVSLLEQQGVESEVFYLAEMHKNYDPGVDVNNNNGDPDAMTELMNAVLAADIFIIATPIWWGLHSSLAQAVVERLTYFDDWAIENDFNALYGKSFGVIITGASDGVQQIMGNLYNFAVNLGFTVPPDSYVSYLGDGGKDILQDQETVDTAKRFAQNLVIWTKLMKDNNIGFESQKNVIKRTGDVAADSLK